MHCWFGGSAICGSSALCCSWLRHRWARRRRFTSLLVPPPANIPMVLLIDFAGLPLSKGVPSRLAHSDLCLSASRVLCLCLLS